MQSTRSTSPALVRQDSLSFQVAFLTAPALVRHLASWLDAEDFGVWRLRWLTASRRIYVGVGTERASQWTAAVAINIKMAILHQRRPSLSASLRRSAQIQATLADALDLQTANQEREHMVRSALALGDLLHALQNEQLNAVRSMRASARALAKDNLPLDTSVHAPTSAHAQVSERCNLAETLIDDEASHGGALRGDCSRFVSDRRVRLQEEEQAKTSRAVMSGARVLG